MSGSVVAQPWAAGALGGLAAQVQGAAVRLRCLAAARGPAGAPFRDEGRQPDGRMLTTRRRRRGRLPRGPGG